MKVVNLLSLYFHGQFYACKHTAVHGSSRDNRTGLRYLKSNSESFKMFKHQFIHNCFQLAILLSTIVVSVITNVLSNCYVSCH